MAEVNVALVIDDERSDLMNVDEPLVVGLDDIDSTGLELITAAVPINGPMELDPVRIGKMAEAPPPCSDERNAAVDAGSEIADGYAVVDIGETTEVPSDEGDAVGVKP